MFLYSGHMFIPEKGLRRVLWLYLGGTRGGIVRLKILLLLKDRPSNINQMATQMKMDYTTIMYHVRVLEKNNMITTEKKKYGTVYFLSPLLERNVNILEDIAKRLG